MRDADINNLRALPEQRDLIDRASALLDQVICELDADKFQ